MGKIVRVSLLLVMLLLSLKGWSLETDQYVTYGVQMEDVLEPLNGHVNNVIRNAVEEYRHKNYSCEKLREKSLKKFRGFFIHKIEHWIEHHLGDKIYPPMSRSKASYFKETIYHSKMALILRVAPLGRNIKANNVYFGADKLAHFFSTGMRYYKKYSKQLKKGRTDEEAKKRAIRYGLFMENSYLGKVVAGVFSFGDLEANYQGLLMNQRFCNGDNPYFEKTEKGYELVRPIDLADFINPMWDESYNRSYYTVLHWPKVKRGLKSKVCSKKSMVLESERYAHYNSVLKPSFSVKYLEQLRQEGSRSVPDRSAQTLQKVCK